MDFYKEGILCQSSGVPKMGPLELLPVAEFWLLLAGQGHSKLQTEKEIHICRIEESHIHL